MTNIRPSAYLARYGYHPKDLEIDAPRRAVIARAVANLARERYGGDVAAAAKRTAQHVGHIASYLTHRSPAVSERMRSNQRWLKETYYPPTRLNVAKSLGRKAIKHGPRAAVGVAQFGRGLWAQYRSPGFLKWLAEQALIKSGRAVAVDPLLLRYERYVDARQGRLPDDEAIAVATAWEDAWRERNRKEAEEFARWRKAKPAQKSKAQKSKAKKSKAQKSKAQKSKAKRAKKT